MTAQPKAMPIAEEVEGIVKRVRFRNPDNGFVIAVLKNDALKPQFDGGEFVVKGVLPTLSEGLQVKVFGHWENHARWGKQFVAIRSEMIHPTTEEGTVAFLSSSLIHGIGPVLARRIVDRFGTRALDILKHEPERLLEISGISRNKLQQIVDSYEEAQVYEEALSILTQYGISENRVIKAVKHFGRNAIYIIKTEPYRLCEIDGIGFLTADKIALNMGVRPDDPKRIRAALMYVLEQAVHKEGHLYLPFDELVTKTFKQLKETTEPVDRDMILITCGDMLANGDLIDEPAFDDNPVYLPRFHRMEILAARDLLRIAEGPKRLIGVDEDVARIVGKSLGITLDSAQQIAVASLHDSNLIVITGGPGTGKTTVIRSALKVLSLVFDPTRLLLAAPTGKAAKRMAEVTGMPAKTIHRLLEYQPAFGGFGRNRENPLEADAIIVDEASMIDLPLLHALLQAIPTGCKLIIVGDVDQLPSVGPGNVLRDIIGSGVAKVTYLNTVFRQAMDSNIIANAHRINQGKMIKLDPDKKDFFFIEEPTHDLVANKIRDLVLRLMKRYDIMDIQVLTPLWKTSTGVLHLNKVLQEAINPPAPNKAETAYGSQIFRVGDKVLQTKNNYDAGVFNGDMGTIVAVHPVTKGGVSPDDSITVNLGGQEVTYKRADFDQIILAYAMTIHRSQGSEWPAIIMALTTQHFIMLARNLVYTGVTRARDILVMAGTKQALGMAINNDRIANRYSLLKEHLLNIKQGSAV